ncbi:MAG: phytanoyl-CoA dioxygenase family protein [Paracoccaceae bacterium]
MSETTPDAATAPDDTDVSGKWEGDNQDWWDWYVRLADNDAADAPFVDVDPLPDVDLPDDAALAAELAAPYALDEADIALFRQNGFVKLKGVLSPGAVVRLRRELKRLLEGAFDVALDGGATDRFVSLEMVWLDNPLVRLFVLSPRIARISAELLGVERVRLYHDNVLSKEPGCGRTPWHYDDHHFPLDTHDVVTPWIPAQPIPMAMGPLAFAMPIDIYKLVESVPFNKKDTSYDRHVRALFRERGVAVDESPFEIGEVSFHHNLNFHMAGTNRTTMSRIVLANTFYADGARIVDSPTMVSGDWQKFMPGCEPGGLAASDLNPVCWPPERWDG